MRSVAESHLRRNMIICSTILLAVLLTGSAFAADWTTPAPVQGVNTQYDEWSPYLSYDGLSLYFSRGYTDTFHDFRIFEAKRATPQGPFSTPQQVLSSSAHVVSPWVSPDNLRMYYHEESIGGWQIKLSQRTSVNNPWSQGTAVNLGSVANPGFSALSSDELTIVFDSHANGSSNWDLMIATRPDRYSSFSNTRTLTELNTALADASPALSPDALTIYFQREGTLFQSTRQSINDPFGNTTHLTAFDIPGGFSLHPAISSNGDAFYFTGGLVGQTGDIYVSYNVPEPATIALLGLGAMALRRRWFLS